MAVRASDFVGSNVGVVVWGVGDWGEGEAEEPGRGVEGGLLDAVEDEVGFDGSLVDRVVGAADLFGIEAPVPGGEGFLEALGASDGGEASGFGGGFGLGGDPDLGEEGLDGVWGGGHGVGEAEVGEGGIAEELGAFLA